MRSAPAAWHVCVHDEWKPLNLEMSAWVEDKHSNDMAKANMKEYIEVGRLVLAPAAALSELRGTLSVCLRGCSC